ncbi:DMT family transporter [Rhodoplanes sp. Z2-YC6860]|uniref:DMT family transporter n=1 Tax=Rhodoplanes sp. Z2-YC6860 TaxID=674703 RepID=UPI00078BEB11|nr:DMT family transporter [Rhodoplanes sp. Z2-YC6860]AMN45248.1 DMT(drug/metabolite transporter) superfamily permease [Rhodoplanes sp. Z2-YC6860]
MTAASFTVSSPSIRIKLPLMVTAFCLLWSSAFAVAKVAIADCPPLLLLTFRFLLAGIVMLAAAALSGVSLKMSRRDLILFAALGVANQAAYLGIGYVGLKSISAGLSALVISANPVLTAVLAATFLGERMTVRKALGLVLGVGGVAFVVQSRLTGGLDHPEGIAFTLVALVSLVIGTILFKLFAPKGGLWVGNGVQSLSAGLAILPFAFTFESVGDIVPTWRLAAAMAFMVLFVSVFAYLLWFKLLERSGATAASSYHFLMPPLGMLFGWLLLGEHVSSLDLAGIVPVALGIYLVTRPA